MSKRLFLNSYEISSLLKILRIRCLARQAYRSLQVSSKLSLSGKLTDSSINSELPLIPLSSDPVTQSVIGTRVCTMYSELLASAHGYLYLDYTYAKSRQVSQVQSFDFAT